MTLRWAFDDTERDVHDKTIVIVINQLSTVPKAIN